MASSVLSLADRPTRGARSSAGMVPSAPRMSPTCASSRTAVRGAVRAMVAMVNTPFTSSVVTGSGAHACGPWSRCHDAGIRHDLHLLRPAGREFGSGQFSETLGCAFRGGHVGVHPEQNGRAARRANFGPDYQSPSRASLLSRRTGAPGRACRYGTLHVTHLLKHRPGAG